MQRDRNHISQTRVTWSRDTADGCWCHQRQRSILAHPMARGTTLSLRQTEFMLQHNLWLVSPNFHVMFHWLKILNSQH